jgi:hypothetical protein
MPWQRNDAEWGTIRVAVIWTPQIDAVAAEGMRERNARTRHPVSNQF